MLMLPKSSMIMAQAYMDIDWQHQTPQSLSHRRGWTTSEPAQENNLSTACAVKFLAMQLLPLARASGPALLPCHPLHYNQPRHLTVPQHTGIWKQPKCICVGIVCTLPLPHPDCAQRLQYHYHSSS